MRIFLWSALVVLLATSATEAGSFFFVQPQQFVVQRQFFVQPQQFVVQRQFAVQQPQFIVQRQFVAQRQFVVQPQFVRQPQVQVNINTRRRR